MSIFEGEKISRATIILVCLVSLGLFFHPQPRFLAFGKEFPAEAIVKKVIDGDTVILEQGDKVRYLGINAPEIRVWNGNQWILMPQIFGKKAMVYNQRLVEGKLVRLEYDQQKRDQYNRLLAYVRVGEVFVNGELVRNGLALMDVRAPNLKYQKMFLALQKDARDFQRGIWGKITDLTISDREAFKYTGRIGVVQGKIINVHMGSKKLYLNFGKDFQKDFTGIIYKENLGNFQLENNDLIGCFLKKRVKIYGFIKNIGGPAIIICAPSQIDILN